jgi:hypothetical protein
VVIGSPQSRSRPPSPSSHGSPESETQSPTAMLAAERPTEPEIVRAVVGKWTQRIAEEPPRERGPGR